MRLPTLRTYDDPEAAIAYLRSPAAIRERCGLVFAAAEAGTLAHFALDEGRLAGAADLVVDTIRAAYPALDIPYHSRWRHFVVGTRDLGAELLADLAPGPERARARVDLAVTSVLLDAGAGPGWSWRDTRIGE